MPKATTTTIAATSLPGPLGPIHLAATERGIVAIDLLAPPDVFTMELERRFGRTPVFVNREAAAGVLRRGVDALEAYLAGTPGAFDDVPLDLNDRPAWDRSVLDAVRSIPWGETSSYGQIAAAIGRRGAARAVGGAVGRNPVSLAIPCHRVIAGDGSLGGYGGGWWGSREIRLGLKRELLAREGTVVPGDRITANSRNVAEATRGARPRR